MAEAGGHVCTVTHDSCQEDKAVVEHWAGYHDRVVCRHHCSGHAPTLSAKRRRVGVSRDGGNSCSATGVEGLIVSGVWHDFRGQSGFPPEVLVRFRRLPASRTFQDLRCDWWSSFEKNATVVSTSGYATVVGDTRHSSEFGETSREVKILKGKYRSRFASAAAHGLQLLRRGP